MAVKFVKIKSSSEEGKTYTIRVFETGEIRCDCPGFVFNGKCKHAVSVAEKILKNTS